MAAIELWQKRVWLIQGILSLAWMGLALYQDTSELIGLAGIVAITGVMLIVGLAVGTRIEAREARENAGRPGTHRVKTFR